MIIKSLLSLNGCSLYNLLFKKANGEICKENSECAKGNCGKETSTCGLDKDAECDDLGQCQGGYYCYKAPDASGTVSPGQKGKCTKEKAQGEECKQNIECSTGNCYLNKCEPGNRF
tara:strand:+ start:253 stop:600 length:348 start_codon:yes stop_codon:yes gene_type:complete